MIMLSVKCDAIHAEKLLFMMFAGLYVAIEYLNTASVAIALHIVGGCPFIND
jgi:hypothetical protein